MKKLVLGLGILALSLATTGRLLAQVKGGAEEHCVRCAMHLAKFQRSLMRIAYADGKKSAVCSLHCAALDLEQHKGAATAAIVVNDYTTRKPVDAEHATWVIVDGKPGVMTARAKWAFERRADAEAFVKEQGGVIATFQEALQAAKEEIATEKPVLRPPGAAESPGMTLTPKAAP